MKARDALVKQGLAKPGRGKFSNDAKQWLNAQVAAGVKFSDYPKESTGAVVPATPATDNTPKPIASNPYDTLYLSPSDFRFPEDTYKAVEVGGKKVHSLRECCNTCRVSLTNHACAAPTIHGNIAVEIVRS